MKVKPSFYLFVVIMYFAGSFKQFILIYACVIAHELMHIVIAKSFRQDIGQITFGATGLNVVMPKLELLTESWKQFAIIIAGPLTNFVLAFVLWDMKFYAHANLALCIFNLLPIYPLDGGRLLLIFLKRNRKRFVILNLMRRFVLCVMLMLGVIQLFHGNMTLLVIWFVLYMGYV